ncbi:hypothetical protein GCM10009785_26770 [Brooklawnia cerclae]|uniref:Bacteriophage Mu GpT domain-containing protein n=1 Tax=Brooklawnia cerclae TaxID=349934 RepID=A0ABX0SHF4_9ACTN|nr:hypothetical protein [Brooklawnia cerclae]NIH57314.1 hypothetical protein [Brooklawnia cerclae]
MSTIELINGAGSEKADDSAFFAGYRKPSHYAIGESAVERANDFLVRIAEGRADHQQIHEAFSTSDFTMSAFAAIDTRLRQAYAELPSVWRQYTDTLTVNDFRPTRLLDKWSNILGLKLVPEATEYPAAAGQDFDQWWISVVKYGLTDGITFESRINNEAIGEIENLPGKLARAAQETETINALSNLLTIDPETNLASDVNTSFFKAGNGNAPTALPLTAENLDAVIDTLLAKKSRRGRLMAAPALQVVIPRALENQANRIRNLRQIEKTTGDTKEVYDNYLKTVDFVVEPMLDAILTHANAATTWFVLPKTGSVRPASFAAFLRGYETADVRVKADAGQSVGGGAISPLEGSFDIDTIQYRARHIVGHQVGDPTFTYVSRGA